MPMPLLGFHTKVLYAFLIVPTCAIFPDHLIPLVLVTLMMFGEECNL
jgi:hypothetical protein